MHIHFGRDPSPPSPAKKQKKCVMVGIVPLCGFLVDISDSMCYGWDHSVAWVPCRYIGFERSEHVVTMGKWWEIGMSQLTDPTCHMECKLYSLFDPFIKINGIAWVYLGSCSLREEILKGGCVCVCVCVCVCMELWSSLNIITCSCGPLVIIPPLKDKEATQKLTYNLLTNLVGPKR